jgi:hypothetical protein
LLDYKHRAPISIPAAGGFIVCRAPQDRDEAARTSPDDRLHFWDDVNRHGNFCGN